MGNNTRCNLLHNFLWQLRDHFSNFWNSFYCYFWNNSFMINFQSLIICNFWFSFWRNFWSYILNFLMSGFRFENRLSNNFLSDFLFSLCRNFRYSHSSLGINFDNFLILIFEQLVSFMVLFFQMVQLSVLILLFFR